LAREGVCVVSGLALGIDGAAHEGALDAGRPTVGVLGGGHACFFPRRNLDLAERMIAADGAVVSPFPPDHPAHPPQFLQRNGVVAALADAVVVVEAAARSGALNTASWAACGSIPVFVFPGDVDRPKVAGCLALIRDGATLVRDAADILEGIGIRRDDRSANQPEAEAALSDLERALLGVLRSGEHTLEGLVARSTATTSATLATLVRLELLGCIERRIGGTYALRG
jgi:DNA processing protein